ncbi:MAG: tRNA pseudouridine(13) synthase TruD [bacterium]
MSSTKEIEKLNQLRQQFPEKFISKVVVEDAALLRKFGINIENKESFSRAFLKMFPQDFIVEEIDSEEVFHSVGEESVERTGSGRYCAATLVKCGMSTLEAVQDIALKLGTDVKNISYAGVKDKKAITAQKIVVPAQYKEKLTDIKSEFYFIKNIHFTNQPLAPGNLKANKFTILLRTNENTDSVEKNSEIVSKYGFKNFYYLQRFGSPRLLSPKYGYLIAKGMFEKLVNVVLFERGVFEIDYFAELREKAKSYAPYWKKVKEEFADFPTILRTEHRLLDSLIAHNGDIVESLKEIPDQTQLWVYALASLLFNNLASVSNEKKLPLCLTRNKTVQNLYSKIYQIIKLEPSYLENISQFKFIPLRDRDVVVNLIPEIHSIKKIEGVGVVLQFTLPKGAYATTFLSHMFNLVSADEDVTINKEMINIKETLGDNSFSQVFDRFKRLTIIEVDIE